MMVDLRCPITPRRLFAQVQAKTVAINPDDNTIVVACADCKRSARKLIDERISLVLHTFNLLGECVDTQMMTSHDAAGDSAEVDG